MLQNGKLVRIVTDVVQQLLFQPRGDVRPADLDRALDGTGSLLAVESRDEVFALVDRLGQALELRTVTEEVGAHGEDDVDWHLGLPGGLEQQLDEVRGFLTGFIAALAKAKDFLELVDEQQQVGALVDGGMPVGLDEAKPASAEGGARLENVFLVFLSEQAGLDQRLGEVGERVATRAHDGQFPRDRGAGHGAAVEFRQQTGTDEG